MRRKIFAGFSCAFLSAAFLSGCAGFEKLENPYVYSDRTSLYESASVSGKAGSFARDICVVLPDTPSADNLVTSEAAALFDLDNHKVMFEKNPFEKLYPASTTKIMTALIAIKYGDLSDEVTVTEDAVITERGATLSGIKPGDKLTMEQLLYGLMLPSGNDAGAAIAVHMDGSIEKFSERMNEEARKLGATGSHFMNPHGLNDDDHYTTAYDLYLIFNEALKYPEFRKVIGTSAYDTSYTDASGNTVTANWKGSNLYMNGERKTPEGLKVFGGKTGTTKAAGSCLVMGSEDEAGHEYVSIVLKAADRSGLYDNMTNIINKIVD